MHRQDSKGKYRVRAVRSALQITQTDIQKYLDSIECKRTKGTIEEYRYSLRLLYEYLPDNKRIGPHTLEQWRGALLEKGYGYRTINARISAANSFVTFCGRPEFRVGNQLEAETYCQPELTRNEYLRLLQTAKIEGKEREYLLIKLFACTGIAVKDIDRVTVDAVKRGIIIVGNKGRQSIIRIPDFLQSEMLEFIRRNGITDGVIFVTRKGTQIRRTNIADNIRGLCRTAQVAEEKGNPRCLRKLYQDTQEGIRKDIEVLVDQAYIRMLEMEQLTIGWDDEIAL